MKILMQGMLFRCFLAGLSLVFVSLFSQPLYAEDQIFAENPIHAQSGEDAGLTEEQLSEVQGEGFHFSITLEEENVSRIILWDEKANIHTDVSIATGTMNHQSNILRIEGR